MFAELIANDRPILVQYQGGYYTPVFKFYPEVAFAGMTETEAREAGYEVVVSKHRFAGNGRAMIVGETDGLVKIVAEKRPDGTGGRILGVHMVGPWVTEQLGQGYLAVNWEATVAEVAQFIQPHPTMSELFGESVLALTGRRLERRAHAASASAAASSPAGGAGWNFAGISTPTAAAIARDRPVLRCR